MPNSKKLKNNDEIIGSVSSDSEINEECPLLGRVSNIIDRNSFTMGTPSIQNERLKIPPTSVIDINNSNNNNKNENNKVNSKQQQQQKATSATNLATKSASTATLIRSKYITWSWRILRRKQVFCFLSVILIYVLYISTVSDESENQDRIPVIHYSHVPGMKDKDNDTEQLLIQPALNSLTVVVTPRIVVQEHASGVITNNNNNNSNISPFPPNISQQNIFTLDINQSHLNTIGTDDVNVNVTVTGTVNYNDNDNSMNNTAIYTSSVSPPPGYLVWSERCKMPNIDPYLPEVMKFFKREKYKPCSVQSPLTYVAYSESSKSYVLRINEDVIRSYSKSGAIDCCYQIIERNSTGINADKDVTLSECITFKKSTKLASYIDNILVKCRAKKKRVYINGHAMMPEREELRQRLDSWRHNDKQQKRHRPPSILMIGIDSISRINLIRAMPKTAQYLYTNEWFEMSGYNKIDDNTFPNLMAVLTGLNKSHAYLKCPPTTLNALDNCSFIWRTFREHGYVTAYGEDEAAINTFNYLKVGFERPPVDYYLRPFLLSAEKHLRVQHKSSLIYCLGYKHSADFVYEYAIELAQRYKSDPFFGLFWTNTFSHNAISDCSAMDEKMVDYLKRFSALGTYENTIVIFFSDHGIRFGPTRATYSGHLEERLPFMFVWLPQHLKQTHPQFVNALSVNKNRLTNPYDLHMTLKHLLRMSGRVTDQRELAPAEDCARCQTLLEPVSHNRSCEDVAIEDHWCTCIPYQSVYKNSKLVQNLAKEAVNYINKYVADFKNGSLAKLCASLQLKSVESAFRAQPGLTKLNTSAKNTNDTASIDTYRLIFQTKPNNALFEATIRYGTTTSTGNASIFEVTGEISRLNSYSSDSECVEDGGAKKYCSCHRKKLF